MNMAYLDKNTELVTCWPADNHNWDGELQVKTISPPSDPVAFITIAKYKNIVGNCVYFNNGSSTYWYFVTSNIIFSR